MRKKPPGWPIYMRGKRLASGSIAYYWEPPSWAKERGCKIEPAKLGTDYAAAKTTCDDILNPHFRSWRLGSDDEASPTVAFGSFDWMVAEYRKSPKYCEKPPKTKRSYDDALAMVARHLLKDGRRFGALGVASITPGAADLLFEKLKTRPDGKLRVRAAVLAMVVSKIAWNRARRSHPKVIPLDNPFAKMQLEYIAKKTRAPTHDELLRLVTAADAAGEPSLGDAAMIAYYWLQREVDILHRFSWTHYRPSSDSKIVKIWHHKTKEEVDLPLYDDDGTPLWPELMARLDARKRLGPIVTTRESRTPRSKVNKPWKTTHFQHRFAEIRIDANIDAEVKFMGLRHGGNTEGANAGLSDAQMRALSGHKTPNMVIVYAQPTLDQRREGARKRRDSRTKKERLSE